MFCVAVRFVLAGRGLAVAIVPALWVLLGGFQFPAHAQLLNPYAGVNWEQAHRLEGDLHMHSTARNTTLKEYVEAAQEIGFDFLMVTRHADGNYHPWEDHGVNPDDYDVIPVYGRESRHGSGDQHVLQVFTQDESNLPTPNDTFQATENEKHAISIIAHPNDVQRANVHDEIEWWIDKFERYDSLVGLEVANYLDQPGDRFRGQDQFLVASDIWHQLLTHFDFDDQIWGFGFSDAHYTWQLGHASTILLAEEKTLSAIQDAIQAGRIFWQVNKDGNAPTITRVDVSGAAITVEAENYEEIKWIYGNEVLKTGNIFAATDWAHGQKYVTFEVWSGPERNVELNDVVGSQPFYIPEPNAAALLAGAMLTLLACSGRTGKRKRVEHKPKRRVLMRMLPLFVCTALAALYGGSAAHAAVGSDTVSIPVVQNQCGSRPT